MNKPHFNTDSFRADSAAGIAPNRPAAREPGAAPRRSTLAGSEATPAANSADAEALRRPSGDVVGPAGDDAARRLHCEVPPSARSWSC
jgi:hypothetical protein